MSWVKKGVVNILGKKLLNTATNNVLKRKIKNNKSKCLRGLNTKSKCSSCFKLCPESAISLVDSSIIVDELLCTGCNVCVSACDGMALSSTYMPYRNTTISIFTKEHTNILCNKSSTSNEGINFGCCKTIDIRFLFAYLASDIKHTLYIDLSKCSGCKYNKEFEAYSIADFISEGRGRSNIVFIKNESIEGTINRRDLFKRLNRSIIRYKEDLKTDSMDMLSQFGLTESKDEDINSSIRVLLDQGLSNNNTFDFAKEFIYQLEIDSRCTLCHDCVISCPTEALSYGQNSNEEYILFDIDKCTFCKRCINSCQLEYIKPDTLKDFDKRKIFKKHLIECRLCKSKTSDDYNGLCMPCSMRKNNKINYELV